LTDELVEQVRGLSDADKERLLELTYPQYDPGTPAERAALKAELTRRWERLRSGEDVAIPADECLAELRRRADARRRS
jgi:hypothetical protein